MEPLEMTLLYDYYGDLLTERQRSCVDLRYNQDLSLAEIGEPMGITRQAVRSLIKRTESILENYEDKLGFAQRLSKMRECFGNISEAAGKCSDNALKETLMREVQTGLSLL